jgi:hypothetical protein
MKNLINASALSLAIAMPIAADAAAAKAPTHDELQSQISALLARMEQLEARNAQLEQVVQQQSVVAAGQAPVADRLQAVEVKSAALEKRVAEAEATNDQQSDNLAKDLGASWARGIKLKGDLRYRHETIDKEGSNQRYRDRIRARIGIDAKVNDTVSAGFQLATGGDDPRSSNQTLGDSAPNQRRSIGLDLAYLAWKPGNGPTTLVMGKMPQPWFKPGSSMLIDNDINPEGVALRYAGRVLFANGWMMRLRENSAVADSNVFGAQVGAKLPVGSVSTLTAAASYWRYQHVNGFLPSPLFANSANGNTTTGSTANNNLALLSDFEIWQIGAQFDTKLGALPLALFADYLHNSGAVANPTAGRKLDTSYVLGLTLGKAAEARSWELGVMYQDNDKDAQFGQLIDSDFGDGSTDAKGFVIRAGYAFAKNWVLNATYFDNTLRKDVGVEQDYKRLQVDMNVKF